MIVRLALLRALVDMAEDAEAELRILEEDLPLGPVVGQVLGDEIRIGAGPADQLADLLAAFRTGIRGENAVRFGRKFLESERHQRDPP